MEVAEIPDLSLAQCLDVIAKHFDLEAIAERKVDASGVLEYYRLCDRGYRLFHSKEGAYHVALNSGDEFTTAGYLGQVTLIAERLRDLSAKQVMEVGSGTGYNLRHLAAQLRHMQFLGVDLSAEHVAMARHEASPLQNVTFEQGDFHQLRFEDDSFDALLAVECLCQGTDWQGAVRELQRVLRPQGTLIVIDCFRRDSLKPYDENLQLAAKLVEKTMAVDQFAQLDAWLDHAAEEGLALMEQLDLSAEISHNLARFYSLSRRFFKMPLAARAFLKAFPQRLLENAISGMLMPFTVGSGLHRYMLLTLEKR